MCLFWQDPPDWLVLQISTTQRTLSTGSRVASPVRGRTGEIARIFDPVATQRGSTRGGISAIRSSLSPSRWAGSLDTCPGTLAQSACLQSCRRLDAELAGGQAATAQLHTGSLLGVKSPQMELGM